MSEYQPTAIPSYDQYDESGDPIVECRPQPKHERAVFARIAQLDAVARQRRLGGGDQAAAYVNRLVVEAKQLLKKEGLLKKQVIASGPDIQLPEVSVGVESGDIDFTEATIEEGDIEGAFALSNVIGPLKTITGMVEPASYDNNGMPVDWRVGLQYLIVSDVKLQPHGKLELYARAPVATTVIEYSDDNRLRVLREALDRLLVVDSMELVVAIDELNTLAAHRDAQTATTMVRIGELVHDLYNSDELTEQQRGALYDIVEYNLFDPYLHDIKAKGVYRVDEHGCSRHVEGDEGVMGHTGVFDQIVIAPGFAVNEDDPDTAVRTDECEAFYMVGSGNDVYYFPLLGMQRFGTKK